MANTPTLGLPKPEASNRLIDDVERLKTAFDGFDAAIAARATQTALAAHSSNQQNPHGTTAAQTGAIPATSDSVTDGYIGSRTVDQTKTVTGNADTITNLLSALAGRVRAIMGATNWYDNPPISLQSAQSHINTPGNPHGTTAAQVGAIPASGGSVNDTYIGARTANIVLAPTAQSNNGVELATWLGWIINRIRAITGTTNWYDAPGSTLAGAATHAGNTSNPHSTTAAQVGAPTTTGTGATGTWGIGITGNAATATKLATARTINGVSFDGSANIEIPVLKSLQTIDLDKSSAPATAGGEFSFGSYFDYPISAVTPGKCMLNVVSGTGTTAGIKALQNGTAKETKLSVVNGTTLRISLNSTIANWTIMGSVQIVEFG